MTLEQVHRRVIAMPCDRPGVGRLAHEIAAALIAAQHLPDVWYLSTLPPPHQPCGRIRR